MPDQIYDPSVVTVHASAVPADDIDAEPHRWTVQATDYDAALVEIRATLPAGWILQHVQIER